MGKSFQHTTEWPSILGVKTNAPLDTRQVVQTVDDLTSAFTDATVYNTMVVGVEADSSIYILINKNNWQTISAWKKLASASDLSGLSGVFTFKGVAESINEAQTILTLSLATATKDSNTYTIKCQTIGYEYDMDIYYGWGVTADSILFWTDTPTLTASSVQYATTIPISVTKLVLNGVDYYPVDGTEPAVDGMKRWESVVGEVVYCDDPSQVYIKDTADDKNLLGAAERVTYEAYDFVPLPDADKYTVSDVASAIEAATGNSGHVYQIGENEYASNGTIWVKLGSPVEDWIII